MQTISIRAGQWTPAAKSVIRDIEEIGIDKIKARHGSVENYAITTWFLPPAIAALIYEHYQARG